MDIFTSRLGILMSAEVSSKSAVILVNLGTPEEPTPAAVRKFLREFLSDQRVVEIPKPIWWLILNCLILPRRPIKVAKAYASIWTEQGSPLRAITIAQFNGVKSILNTEPGFEDTEVCYAMSYGKPGLVEEIERLEKKGVRRIAVIPLYPQYSATTTAVVYDQIAKHQLQSRNITDIRVCKHYYQRDDYINALASSVDEFRALNGTADKLLMSFHGIPQRCVDLGDPYFEQCAATASALAEKLGLSESQWKMSFQSRLGRAQWLQPYTVAQVKQWGAEGVKSIQVICPAFSSDCLETKEEIAIEIRDDFLQAGGESFAYIPCLNDSKPHLELFSNISTNLLSY